jgi:GNAT superfamily N-acetyltransferase
LPIGPQLIVPNLVWATKLTELLGDKVKRIPRFGFSHETLNIDHLRALKENLSPEFVLERIDLDTARTAPRSIAPAIPFFFGSPESFIERGFGYCIKHDGVVVSTAMTAMPFEREFEIEVDTIDSPDYRRKGLATVASAALVEHALMENLVPIWDAANNASKALALKLGYSNMTPYNAFTKLH